MTSPAWQCSRCLALNWAPGSCRACHHPRNAPPPLRVARPRTLLGPPRQDLPVRKSRRTRPAIGAWVFPVLLLLASVTVAAFWDPITARLSLVSAQTYDRARAWAVRHEVLALAVDDLRALHAELLAATAPGAPRLAPDWSDRLTRTMARHALHGAEADPRLADDEVALRVVALELFALKRRFTSGSLGDDARARLAATPQELDRISEDLANVP